MEDARTILRVLSSRPTLGLAGGGLLILAMLGLDVPQGLPDREILASWPLASGPYVVAFGLHHLARSPFLWGALLLAALHLAAVRLRTPDARPRGGWTLAVAAPLLAAALVFAASDTQPPLQPDITRLTVHVMGADGRPASQPVEEGAAYRMPSRDGERTLLFGSASLGPYAVEARDDATPRIHLAMPAQDGAVSDMAVSARRPLAHPRVQRAPSPGWGNVLIALGAAVIGLWTLWQAARALRRRPQVERNVPLAGIVAAGLAVLVNPWFGPGSGLLPVSSGFAGQPVLFRLMTRDPSDVAAWAAWLPAGTHATALAVLAGIAAFLGLVTLIWLVAAQVRRVGPSGASAGLVAVTGVAFLACGALLLLHAVARVPLPLTTEALAASFQQDLLPRIAGRTAVLSYSLSHAGPYTIPLWAGLAPALGLVTIGALLFLAGRNRKPSNAPPVDWHRTLLLLTLAGLLRAGAAQWLGTSTASPAGVVPVALVAAGLAALGLFANRADRPDWALTPVFGVCAALLLLVLTP